MSFRNVAAKKRFARAAFAVGVIAGLVLAGSGSLVVSGEKAADKDKTGIISPSDHAVLLSGNIEVICKTDMPCFEIDSQKHEWEFCGNPVHAARIRLFPGIHELNIGGKKIEVVVALNEDEHDGPASWKIQRSHKMDNEPARCQGCHEVDKKPGLVSVGKVKPNKACLKCHEARDLKEEHPGIAKPLEDCQACHALHGSPHKSLLKAPKGDLLAEYGNSGH